MKAIFDTYRPDGFTTVNSYLFTKNPTELINFLKAAFYAEEINRSLAPDGAIGNCILKIGDSCFMITQARQPFLGMTTALYFFVEDVDKMYQNALSNGATSVFPPDDMDYGDRQGGIMDVSGNYWWISKRLENKGYEE